ncbi:leukotriene B4 receptor 1-like [Plectropomus leopardus]|uniref:leukotriene B4 receptor 1-like n=1 Tax=Plectropomus leopardus TaxID=160734 RepID=UPI001C4BC8A7|nr:leukotriene B4 receptor 1-like [Plectropomus leopardus]
MNHSAELSPSEEMAPKEFDDGTVVVAACVILGLSFLVGAPGNLLVIWTILRHVKKRSHTVVLILNLAAADLLVLITLPMWIYSLVHTWVFGGAVCMALMYIIRVCMFGSIFFITLMSVERYLAICHPFVMMGLKTKSVMKSCLVVLLWLLALLLGLPAVLTESLDESYGNQQCFIKEFNSNTQEIILSCLDIMGGFIVPFIIVSMCYCLVAAKLRKKTFNSKQKSIALVGAVVIAFSLCWLPHHIINIINVVCIIELEHECVPQSVVYSSGALVFISSSVNPVLYTFFARNLRGNLAKSRLVCLFQEKVAHTNKLRDLVVQPHTGQRAANTTEELISDSEKKLNP